MKRLVIISPKDGSFAKILRLLSIFHKIGECSTYAYFIYIGEKSPNDKVCGLLSSFNFNHFSLYKKFNYLIFKVYVE